MDFTFSEEQEMLRAQARSFIADRFPLERAGGLASDEAAWDRRAWRDMAELGWTSLSVPEEHGGAGMTFVEEAVLFEELGYGLYPGPYFSTVVLTLPALGSRPEALEAIAKGEIAATLGWAEPDGSWSLGDVHVRTRAVEREGRWLLSGTKHFVPDVGLADEFVVVARSPDGVGLWSVGSAAAHREVVSTMDRSRVLGRLEMTDSDATLLVAGEGALDVLRLTRLRALAALALEAVGIAQRVLELAADYSKSRRQFGKPIGAYQAVSHQVANIYGETELARSLAYWAAWCVAESDEQAGVATAAAKAFAAEAAVAACERSIQVHGGIGFTWEHVLHRYYKRAQWIESFEGFGAEHRREVARALLG